MSLPDRIVKLWGRATDEEKLRLCLLLAVGFEIARTEPALRLRGDTRSLTNSAKRKRDGKR
jgi:hypothetical protein